MDDDYGHDVYVQEMERKAEWEYNRQFGPDYEADFDEFTVPPAKPIKEKTMSNEIVTTDGEIVGGLALSPAMTTAQAIETYGAMVDFVRGIMKEGIDFGIIPGTPKPTLLKPGAEKLTRFFGLSVRFELTGATEQWGSEGQEPLFYYRYRCELYRIVDGELISQGEGSCNSREKKYRYRNADRTCPECGKSTIIKGKQEFGGGWVCFKKKGGCGYKFEDDDARIISQESGTILNPDLADQINTIQKMAQKRAMIAAVLVGCNASEFFTQDIEDMDIAQPTPSPAPEAEHWTATQNWGKFWGYIEGKLGLTRDQAHEALGVESAVQFAGTKDEAMSRLQAYAARLHGEVT